MTWNVRKLISLRFQCTSITNRFFGLFDRFTTFSTIWPKMSENSYLHHFSAQVSQIVFLAYLTVLQLVTTLWLEMSENSYLRHFSAQVSQSVFLAYLTVLRLNTTVWPEMSENSYLRYFNAQVSQYVFFVNSPFNGLLQHYDLKFSETHISTISVHKYHKSCS